MRKKYKKQFLGVRCNKNLIHFSMNNKKHEINDFKNII